MIDLPDPESIESVSDWVELTVITSGDRLPKALVSSAIEGAAGREPSDDFVSSVWRELSSRQQLYRRSFFAVEEYAVEPQSNSETHPDYVACLLLSLYGIQGSTKVPSRLFERLVRVAMAKYLSGQAVIFGWPFKENNDEESEEDEGAIKQKIKKVADDLQERFSESPPARFKDRGVDVIGWIPFGDQRTGQAVVLLQCAAGHNWHDKLPVPLEAWCQYIHWASNPIKAFAVPCVVRERDWHEKSKDKGILFDRIRILNLVPTRVEDEDLYKDLKSWANEELSAMA